MGADASAEHVQMERPQVIEIDEKNRELVITDTRNHRIGRFTLDGKLIAWLAHQKHQDRQVSVPMDALADGDGTALVVEFGNNRLNRVDLATGKSLGTIGRAGREPGEFANRGQLP